MSTPTRGRYELLDSQRVIETVERLALRIEERFPGSGLAAVCRHLLSVARQIHERSEWVARPVWGLRIGATLIIAAVVAGTIATPLVLRPPDQALDLLEFVQILESAINDVILIGAALFFLVSLETRIKRGRALAALHELRALAHIIDMHQLTKDPERIEFADRTTASSPTIAMSSFELNRYLDYATEMLSLTGKLAAMLVERFNDGVVTAAAGELESLTTGLSRKIWQKIMILNAIEDAKLPGAKGQKH